MSFELDQIWYVRVIRYAEIVEVDKESEIKFSEAYVDDRFNVGCRSQERQMEQ